MIKETFIQKNVQLAFELLKGGPIPEELLGAQRNKFIRANHLEAIIYLVNLRPDFYTNTVTELIKEQKNDLLREFLKKRPPSLSQAPELILRMCIDQKDPHLELLSLLAGKDSCTISIAAKTLFR